MAAREVRAGRAFVELGVSDKYTAGLRKASASLQRFGNQVGAIGKRLALAGAAALAPLALSTKTFAGFEQQMARVKALTNAAAPDFDRLTKEARRLGETTVFTATQAAEAMGFFALAGFDVDQIMKSIGPTLDTAAAGQIGIAESADIAAKIMAGMGIAAEDVGEAMDVMVKAFTTANTNLIELGDAMKYVGPLAEAAGKDLTEVVAAIQLLSSAGMPGEQAGTALRMMLLSLTSPGSEAEAQLKALGVEILDQAGNVRHFADIIDDFNTGLGDVGSGERLKAIGKVLPARSATAFAKLLSLGGDQLREFQAALQDATGTAARVAGTQMDTLTGDVTILISALEGLQIAVGESLGKPLRRLAVALTTATQEFSKMAAANPKFALGVAVAAASVLGLGVALVGFGVAVKLLAVTLIALILTIKILTALFAVMVSPITAVVAALAVVTGAVLHFSGAGAAALSWLGKKFGELKEIADKAFAGIADALAAGDIQMAGEILWAGLRLAFLTSTVDLLNGWSKFAAAFKIVWVKAVSFVAETTIRGVAFMKRAWLGLSRIINAAIGLGRDAADEFNRAAAHTSLEIQRQRGDVSDEHAAVLSKMIDKHFDEKIQNRRKGETATEEGISARLNAIRAKRDAEIKALHELELKAATGFNEQAAKDIAARREEIRKLTQQLDEFRKSVAAARALEKFFAGVDGGSDAKSKAQEINPPALDVEEISDALKIASRGSFNALAALSFQGASAADRTAKATEETAKNTKRLLRNGGGAFV